jgi:hypothetical protein
MPKFQNDPVVSISNSTNTPAVQGESSGNEGVRGISHDAHGGVVGVNDWTPSGPPGAGGNGGWFESTRGEGVRGWSKNPYHGGVVGVNTAGGIAVYGQSDDGTGVVGESKNNEGVRGVSHSAHGGVVGVNDWSPSSPPGAGGNGGWFESTQGEGVRGWSKNPNHGGVVGVNTAGGIAVFGTSDKNVGVWGTSVDYEGIHAETKSSSTAAMAAYQMNPASKTAAFFAKHMGNLTAGVFEGDVVVTGDIRLTNADCAEDFNIGTDLTVEPGTVMVINEEGALDPSREAYDKKVAGVVSGGGEFKPGIILDKQESPRARMPIALIGKVYCKADARYRPIGVGDLLTTSETPGHAMKANDPRRSFGAVIGKALQPLRGGTGLIPILIALQ